MLKLHIYAGFAILMVMTRPLLADETAEAAKKGAPAYRICAACHSLQPGVHLSGPSLANMWGKKAGTVSGYGRYTVPLKKSDIVWDEHTLNAWLADPQAMVPGTTMMFRGVEKDETRTNLITFLRHALAEGGTAKVVEDGLIPKDMADGQIPPITAATSLVMIVTTTAGAEYPFWETNLRIKIDTSERGPKNGKPVLLRSGMAGDRISVVFPSLEALKTQLTDTCRG